MSTAAVTPDTGAAPAGGSAAPDSGASSTPSTPATPATPAAAPDIQPGQSAQDYIRQQLEKVDISKVTDVEKPVVDQPAPPKTEAVEDPNAHPATEKTPEQIEAERVAAEQEAAKNEPNPLDTLGPLPAEKVAEALKDPAFVEMCKAKGIDPDTFMQTSRDAAEVGQYREIVGTPETAKYLKQGAESFFTLDDKFPKIKDVGTLDDFLMNDVLPMTYILGEDGQPLKNPDGTFQTDGSMDRFVGSMGELIHGMAAEIASKLPEGDETADLKLAIQMVSDFVKNGYKLGKPAELTPEQKAVKEQLDKREQAINQRDTEQKTAAVTAFAEKAWTDANKGIEPMIGEIVKSSGLSEGLQARATDEIYGELANKLAADVTYQRLKGDILNRDRSEKGQKELVALHKSHIHKHFKTVANEVMKVYGGKVVSDSAARNDKINTQLGNDRMNQGAATTAGKPSGAQPLSSEAVLAQAEQDVLNESGGKRLADHQQKVISKVLAIRAKQANIA